MKRSRRIALTLMASACILATGCNSEQKTQRNVYASKEDCVKDWNSDECESKQTSSGSRYYGPHYFYSGGRPWYFPRGQDAPVETRPSQGAYTMSPGQRSSHALSSFASAKTSRGGFGHSSSFHGGSGS